MTAAPGATSSAEPWRTCEACGLWQRVAPEAACTACHWARLLVVTPDRASDASALRTLVDLELRSDGTWHISRLSAARLPHVLAQAAPLKQLQQHADKTLRGGLSPVERGLPALSVWETFHKAAHDVIEAEFNHVIAGSWPGPDRPSTASVVVSIRTWLLDPDVAAQEWTAPDWLEFVSFTDAAGKAAAEINDRDVVLDLSSTRIGFDADGAQVRTSITSPSELLIESGELRVGTEATGLRALWKGPLTCVVRRNTPAALPPVVLSADAVRGLAPGAQASLRLTVRGRPSPFVVPLPAADVPPPNSVADLLLDLGSTTTKWALRCDGRETAHGSDATARLVEIWGLREVPYQKKEFLADPTGERWCDWMTRALTALRRWVGREHKAYLRNVIVSLPATGQFDVARLARELLPMVPVRFTYPLGSQRIVEVAGSFNEWTRRIPMAPDGAVWAAVVPVGFRALVQYRFVVDETWVSDPGNDRRAAKESDNSELEAVPASGATPSLLATSVQHLACRGRVILVPEHKALADHYVSVLEVLQKAVRAYAGRFKSHEQMRADQERRRLEWEAKDAQVKAFAKKGGWHKFWNSAPEAPTGPSPTVHASLTSPAAWMTQLANNPALLERVVLLDAGGLSLDIAVLDKHALVAELSSSDATCGGEEISKRVGRGDKGSRGTEVKARLGKQWMDYRSGGDDPKALLEDVSHQEYRDATRSLHEHATTRLFAGLARRWGAQCHATILLTGGGSRNPHIGEYVREVAGEASVLVTIMDAQYVEDLLEQAARFSEPLPDLKSPAVERFTEAQRWAKARRQHAGTVQDPFAVVGGLLAASTDDGR